MPLPEDKLTKLTSENELLAELRYEMERARRYGWELGLLLVEPDLPSEIGVDMQYTVLRRLAAVCTSVMRAVDKGIRFQSGVLYLLPETPFAGVETASNKVRALFLDNKFEHPVSGETFGCGLLRSIRIFSGKAEKDASTDDAALRLLTRQMRDGLKGV
jgi:hypothetical protein